MEHREPGREVAQPLEVTSQGTPIRFCGLRGKPVSDGRVVEVMEKPRVDQLNLVRIEMRRSASEGREIEPVGQFVKRGNRLDRLGGSDPREHVEKRHRLDTFLAQMLGAVRSEALRQLAL